MTDYVTYHPEKDLLPMTDFAREVLDISTADVEHSIQVVTEELGKYKFELLLEEKRERKITDDGEELVLILRHTPVSLFKRTCRDWAKSKHPIEDAKDLFEGCYVWRSHFQLYQQRNARPQAIQHPASSGRDRWMPSLEAVCQTLNQLSLEDGTVWKDDFHNALVSNYNGPDSILEEAERIAWQHFPAHRKARKGEKKAKYTKLELLTKKQSRSSVYTGDLFVLFVLHVLKISDSLWIAPKLEASLSVDIEFT